MEQLFIYLLLVMLPSIAITGWAAWRVRSTYARWSKVDSGINEDAFTFARRLLDRNGLTDVRVEGTPGNLPDHYDPRGKVLRVSASVAGRDIGHYDPTEMPLGVPAGGGRLSVAAAAVIAHEVGHALQDREGDPWMAVRQAIVPAVQTMIPGMIRICSAYIRGSQSGYSIRHSPYITASPCLVLAAERPRLFHDARRSRRMAAVAARKIGPQ
jgi:Zn-dependent membrane protease YugP